MVKIIADSTCDLTKELVEAYEITIVPLHILLGDKEYRDGTEISPEDIYAWSDANRTTPKTSAASLEDVLEAMKKILDDQHEIIAFCISEQMSTNGNVLRMAAEELNAAEQVTVIDSRNLSTGIGHLVIEAALLAKQNKPRQEIVSYIEKIRPLVRASFVVDTLIYLHRGGRCSGLAAMAGGMLKLHPRIAVTDGVMNAGKKYRGKLSAVILNYVKDMETALRSAKEDRVFITHSGCDDEIVKEVSDYLKSLNHFKEIIVTRAGGVISSHCGPGTLGVLFIEKEY